MASNNNDSMPLQQQNEASTNEHLVAEQDSHSHSSSQHQYHQQQQAPAATTTASSTLSLPERDHGPSLEGEDRPPRNIHILPGKLTLVEQLLPPLQTIGHEDSSSSSNTLRYPSQSPAWAVEFSPNGNWLAACYGAPDPCVRLWTRQPQAHGSGNDWILHSTLQGIHERTIRSIAFAPLLLSSSNNNTTVLAVASFDASVSIWEHSPKKHAHSTNNNTTTEWECTTQLEGHDHEIKHVQWNATGSLLATCGRDKTVWIWETWLDGTIGGSATNPFECLAVLTGSEADVKCIQFAPSHGQWGHGDEILLSAGYDDTIRIWAEEDGGDWYCAMTLNHIHTDTIWSMTLAPGGGRLLTASADGSIAILKHYTAKEQKEWNQQQQQQQQQQQAERPIPNTAVTSRSESTGLFKCVGRLPNAHSSTIYSIHYAPAKAGHGRIVSGGADNRIQVYREVIGSSSDQPLFVMDAAVNTTTHGDINCVRWHPWDGSLLASASDDGSVQLWKFETS